MPDIRFMVSGAVSYEIPLNCLTAALLTGRSKSQEEEMKFT